MPQKIPGAADGDGRSEKEKTEFDRMLSCITDLYLTTLVLIILDNSSVSRFWPLMEAWCSMMTVTEAGVSSAVEASHRYTIECIGNADPEYDIPKLEKMLKNKTPKEILDKLAENDVLLTNAKDKETMLPIVLATNEHIKEMLERAAYSA